MNGRPLDIASAALRAEIVRLGPMPDGSARRVRAHVYVPLGRDGLPIPGAPEYPDPWAAVAHSREVVQAEWRALDGR